MFLDRDKQTIPGFASDSEAPRSGKWWIRMSNVAIFKKAKKTGRIYLVWPFSITHNENEEIVEGYEEIEWSIFFDDLDELTKLLIIRFGLDKSSILPFIQTYHLGQFLDGKEPVLLPKEFSHKSIIVELSPGWNDKAREVKVCES